MIFRYQVQNFQIIKQKIVPTYGKHHGAKLIGSLDYETGEVFCTQEIQYTAQEFLSFLEKLLKKYGNQNIVLVLDNAKIHHAALIQPYLQEHQSVLTLLYLPPYSPKLNLIEGLWGWLKEAVINNVFFNTIQKIRKAVQGFIHEINKTPEVTVDRLCVQLYIPNAENIDHMIKGNAFSAMTTSENALPV